VRGLADGQKKGCCTAVDPSRRQEKLRQFRLDSPAGGGLSPIVARLAQGMIAVGRAATAHFEVASAASVPENVTA
jgi:hypothetical protein